MLFGGEFETKCRCLTRDPMKILGDVLEKAWVDWFLGMECSGFSYIAV
jgi:hypothetical protein